MIIKPIEGFPGYFINMKGEVYSEKSGRVLKNMPLGTRGVPSVDLYDGRHNRKTVHRLVAKAFLPNPQNLPVVNHKDGDPTNSNVSNLEWCSYRFNTLHGVGRGIITTPRRASITSKHKGVYWHKTQRKWLASMRVHQKLVHLGSFGTEQLALDAYKKFSEANVCYT